MLFHLLLLLLVICGVQSQPVACNDDSHCPADFYCMDTHYVCNKCLNCQEWKRFPPPEQVLGQPKCLKTVHQCGSCFDGWVLYTNGRGLICVPAEMKNAELLSRHIYIWFIGAACGLLITLLYLQVLRNTDIVKIDNHIPIYSMAQKLNLSPLSLKELLRHDEDTPRCVA